MGAGCRLMAMLVIFVMSSVKVGAMGDDCNCGSSIGTCICDGSEDMMVSALMSVDGIVKDGMSASRIGVSGNVAICAVAFFCCCCCCSFINFLWRVSSEVALVLVRPLA